jgi:hypothetical protein
MFGIPEMVSSGNPYTLLVFTFFLGLFTGAGRCLVICGPLFVPLATSKAGGQGRGCAMAIAFGSGRLLTYIVLGALFGAFGNILSATFQSMGYIRLAYSGVGILGIIFGLVLLGENAGFITSSRPCNLPNLRRFHRDGMAGTFVLGFAVGWVPCPPLIEMLALTLAKGEMVLGAIMLLVFGTGTAIPLLPVGYFAGGLSSRFLRFQKRVYVDRLAGFTLILFGLYLILVSRGI